MKKMLAALLIFSFALSSCKKNKSADNEDFPYYFSATINGAEVKYVADDLNSQYECGVSSPYFALGDDYDIYEGTFIQDGNDNTKKNIYVHFLKYFDHEPDFDERVAMVSKGNYTYGESQGSSSTINGASIMYTDAIGKEWFSEGGSQAGSSFTVTELETNSSGTSLKLFKATFSCKLYDGAGGSIQVNNAVIRGKLLIP